MNAYYLHKPDGTKTEVSACGICGQIAGKGNFDISQKCCTCYECGAILGPEEKSTRALYHRDCENKRHAVIEMKRLEKAELVTDYSGPVYCEGVPGGSFGDGYFSDIGELEDMLNDAPDDTGRPEFAYCCTSSSAAHLSTDSILESATEEAFEDAIDSLSGVDELRAAVDAFNEANKDVLSWDWDMKRKVAVPRDGAV